jgi:hypothetical protein
LASALGGLASRDKALRIALSRAMFEVRVEAQPDRYPQFLAFQRISSDLPQEFAVDQLAELSRFFAQFIVGRGRSPWAA